MEGVGTSAALNVDGGEIYTLRTASQFLASYNWRKFDEPSAAVNSPFIPTALRAIWPQRLSVSFGVYDKPFAGATMDASIVKTTLINALAQADHYVWFYTEGPTFLRPSSAGGATAAWVDAVRQALGTVPAPAPVPAPQALLAMPMSSAQVDVSWTSSAAGLTGFKVERKTGSGGSYSQVALVAPTALSYNDTAVAETTTYFYRVRATTGATDSPFSSEANATTPASTPAPGPAPTPAPTSGGGGGGGACGLLGIEGAIALALIGAIFRKNRRTG
jgi:hypothetical protein